MELKGMGKGAPRSTAGIFFGYVGSILAIGLLLPRAAGAAPVDVDEFVYPDGSIGDVTTNAVDGWARNGTVKSDWSGDAVVIGQELMTDGTEAWRAFGDPRSTAAYQGGGSYFWKVEMVYDGASEAVVSTFQK